MSKRKKLLLLSLGIAFLLTRVEIEFEEIEKEAA